MKTIFHKQFAKQYAKLPDAQKKRFEKAITLFRHNPNHPALYNHPLTGQWRLDYVFATPDVEVALAQILSTDYSDHLPVRVEIRTVAK